MASSGRLKPGEKGKIKVTVNTKGKSGLLSKNVTVRTNDPEKPVTTLTLKMVVESAAPNPAGAH